MTTEQILEINERRFVSQRTGIVCASCGADFKISNRHLLPFEFEIGRASCRERV